MKPRVLLDRRMLDCLNNFYSSTLSDDYLNNECFSHPVLESHICNIKAPLDGGELCNYCKHIVGRRCNITCHIHHFCLSVFAYRLGIGGEDVYKAIKHNTTKLSFNKLQQVVMKALGVKDGEDENEDGEAQDINRVEMKPDKTEKIIKEIAENVKPKPKPKPASEPIVDSISSTLSDDLISVGEAAKLYGCSYFNMYSHIKRGNLKKIIQDSGHYVSKAAVMAMKENKDNPSNNGNTEKDKLNTKGEKADARMLECVCGKKIKSKSGLTLHQKNCEIFNGRK